MLEAQQNEHQVLKIDIRGNITKFAMVIEMAGIFLLFQILTDGVFLSSLNLSNLLLQGCTFSILGIGMVWVKLDLLDSYLYIQNIRFKGKIRSEWSIEDESLLQQKILKFTLQPLVENAIIHGLADLPQGGEILIICDTHKTDLRIRILDDGVGIEPDRLAYIQAILSIFWRAVHPAFEL